MDGAETAGRIGAAAGDLKIGSVATVVIEIGATSGSVGCWYIGLKSKGLKVSLSKLSLAMRSKT